MTTANPPSVTALGSNCAFFLDVDGTLLELASQPDEVVLKPGLCETLQMLRAAAGEALALISGRAIADLDRLFNPLIFPAAGQHGLERRDYSGVIHRHAPADGAFDHLRATLSNIAAAHPGILLEDKGFSLAVHYRQDPQQEKPLESVLTEFIKTRINEYRLQRGKLVYEVIPGGRNKGTAIEEFMSESPFTGKVPVFIGDDVTDEDGFACVNELGGYSIKVGAGKSRAHWRLAGSEAVLVWLQSYVRAIHARAKAP